MIHNLRKNYFGHYIFDSIKILIVGNKQIYFFLMLLNRHTYVECDHNLLKTWLNFYYLCLSVLGFLRCAYEYITHVQLLI